MAVKVEVRGQAELRALTRNLKEFGEKDIRREFYRALQKASRPMLAAAKTEAVASLPRGGGAGQHVSDGLKARTSTRGANTANPRVRVVFSGQSADAQQWAKARRKDVSKSRRRAKAAAANRAKGA